MFIDLLTTDQSEILETLRSDCSEGRDFTQVYQRKMDDHLNFMEMEFRKNIQHQRNLMLKIRNRANRQSKPNLTLHLNPKQELTLKNVIKKCCFVQDDNFQLKDLIKLAISSDSMAQLSHEDHYQNFYEPNLPQFPDSIIPSSIFGNQMESSSSLAKQIQRIPKLNKVPKETESLFLYEPIAKQCQKQDNLNSQIHYSDKDSLINILDSQNFKYDPYALDNLSFTSSQQNQKPITNSQDTKEFELVLTDETKEQNCIYLNRKEGKMAKAVNQQKGPFLQFNPNKKRKIAKSKDKKMEYHPNSMKESMINASSLKEMRDSFGKSYYEYFDLKDHKEEKYGMTKIMKTQP